MTEGKIFDRVSMTWLEPNEYARRRQIWEELAFQARGNQGQLATPMIITDGHKPVQSMTNGKIYDSKSALRREYKRAGVEEVGNEQQTKPQTDKAAEKKKRQASIGRALSYAGFGA
jgi:hypothetical protein